MRPDQEPKKSKTGRKKKNEPRSQRQRGKTGRAVGREYRRSRSQVEGREVRGESIVRGEALERRLEECGLAQGSCYL